MIVIDTSALIAIVLEEAEAGRCRETINTGGVLKISAGTIAEALIVASGRNLGDEMRALLKRLDLDIAPVTASGAERIAEAYQQWGKGNHPARLNFGDCFAYALAREAGCPLLFVGNDFARTDVMRA